VHGCPEKFDAALTERWARAIAEYSGTRQLGRVRYREAVFSPEQRQQFARDGFIVVPRLVEDTAVERVRSVIAGWMRSRDGAPERTDHPAVLSLLHDAPTLAVAESLVGGALRVWGMPQVALRAANQPARALVDLAPHIDGVPVEGTGLPVGGRKLLGFTLLAGVLLTEQVDRSSGCFVAWPASHARVAEWFSKHGAQIDNPGNFHSEVVPELAGAGDGPVAVGGSAGDVLLAHYLLIHAAGMNSSSRLREAVFFRLESSHRSQLGDLVYTDAWAEWDAMVGHA
jgi:hypothetical protein